MNARLYRCRHDRRLAGVAAGLAEYLDVDVTLVRVVWVVSVFFWGLGLLAYLLLAIIVPLEPEGAVERTVQGAAEPEPPSGHRHAPRADGLWLTVLGAVLIACGGIALLDVLLPGVGRYAWPAALLGLGLALVALSVRRRQAL